MCVNTQTDLPVRELVSSLRGSSMTDKTNSLHPLLTLWYQPGRTVERVTSAGQGHGLAVVIAAMFGVTVAGSVFARLEDLAFGPFALVGAILGTVFLYFVAMLARNFSRWFGGSAELKPVRTALGLALLPWTLLSVWLLGVLLSGQDASQAQVLFPVYMGLFIYGYVILLLSMTAALKVTVLKTFGTLAITAVIAFFTLNLVASLVLNFFGISVPA